jgi:hypothetical protein
MAGKDKQRSKLPKRKDTKTNGGVLVVGNGNVARGRNITIIGHGNVVEGGR